LKLQNAKTMGLIKHFKQFFSTDKFVDETRPVGTAYNIFGVNCWIIYFHPLS